MNAIDAVSDRRRKVASRIQHTLISTQVTADDMERHCEECLEYGFNAAMVGGTWVPLVARLLQGTPVAVVSALDFPTAAMTAAGRVAEAISLVKAGADQIDIGIAVGRLKSGLADEVHDDMRAIVQAIDPVPVKAMLELPLLTPKERELIIELAVGAGVAYVKNASGGAVGTATSEDIRFLRERVPAHVKVKASGGIKTYEQVVSLLDAGAELCGTSSGIAIIEGTPAQDSGY